MKHAKAGGVTGGRKKRNTQESDKDNIMVIQQAEVVFYTWDSKYKIRAFGELSHL